MKKFTAILAALVLTAGMTFAQDSKSAPATKGGAAKNNTDKGGKSTSATGTKTTKGTKPAGKDAKTPAKPADKK